MIAQAAYFRAEHCGIKPGHEREDWASAEKGIDRFLVRGFRILRGLRTRHVSAKRAIIWQSLRSLSAMTNTVASSTNKNAGIWIDHRKAQIVGLTPGGEITTVILSNLEKHLERAGDSPMKGAYEARQVPADDSRQRALTGELDIYYDGVIAALRSYGKVLIFGPGEAKGELHTRLLKMNLGAHVAAVQTEGQMTDRQIVAKVRAYFGLAAPRVREPQ
jgi:hypothetical protein